MKRLFVSHEDITAAGHSQFLDPPEGYGIVTEGITRCGALSPTHFSFLSLYQFKTVLFIGGDSPHQRIVDYFKDRGTKYQQIDVYTQSLLPWKTKMDELVKLSLQFLLDKNNHPVLVSSSMPLIVCTVIGCLRKIQGWNLCSIMDEFRRFTPGQAVSKYKNYVELFDFDLIHFPASSFVQPI